MGAGSEANSRGDVAPEGRGRREERKEREEAAAEGLSEPPPAEQGCANRSLRAPPAVSLLLLPPCDCVSCPPRPAADAAVAPAPGQRVPAERSAADAPGGRAGAGAGRREAAPGSGGRRRSCAARAAPAAAPPSPRAGRLRGDGAARGAAGRSARDPWKTSQNAAVLRAGRLRGRPAATAPSWIGSGGHGQGDRSRPSSGSQLREPSGAPTPETTGVGSICFSERSRCF